MDKKTIATIALTMILGGFGLACFGPIGLVIGVILGIGLAKQTKCD